MRLLIAMLMVVALVAAVTFGLVQVLDLTSDQGQDPTLGGAVTTTTGVEEVPAEGQVQVTGTVTLIHIEGAVLEPLVMPLEVTTPERGSGAGGTFENVIVDREEATIEWDAGRPLEISGDGGSLVLDPVTLDADAASIVISLDGVHGVTPAVYSIHTSVAVGAAGIAEPVDSVDFEAAAGTTVEFRGGAATALVPVDLFIRGPALLVMDGTFEVSTAAGTKPASHIEFPTGPLEVQLSPVDDGYAVTAILQGPVTAS